MGFLDPHAVTGGTGTASQQRRAVFAYTKGATGIDGPEDLKVVAVAGSPGVAGILPGGGSVAVESRRESYAITNLSMDGDALLDIPAAGSSGATHYVIVEVTDPEFHGQEAGATPRLVSSLSGRTRPYLPLARINLAAGESFDATSEVEDLRVVAQPRAQRHLIVRPILQSDGEFRLNRLSPGSQQWPNLDLGDLYIPTWARRVRVIATWAGVYLDRAGDRSHGRIWVRFGSPEDPDGLDTQHTSWGKDTGTNIGDVRETWISGEDRGIPARLRGETKQVRMRGRVNIETPGESRPILDWLSAVSLDVEFYETAG